MKIMMLFQFVLLCVVAVGETRADRLSQPAEGFTFAKDLPEDFTAVVRSTRLEIKDAFDGSTAHSGAENFLFGIGNKLHIESRQGTIRRRLLFHEGDTVTKSLLAETEKALRSEDFLADAIIEARKEEDGTAQIRVTTYDQWTTMPEFNVQRLGGEWLYWIGPVESNFLGTGQRLGVFLGHDQFRDTRWMEYANNALFAPRLRLASRLALLSDGYSTLFSLSKPLETRTDRYAFSASWSAVELSQFVYFDANLLDRLPDSLADRRLGRTNVLAEFDRVATHEVNLIATRSFGRKTKFNLSPTLDWKDRYDNGSIRADTSMSADFSPSPSAFRLDERYDFLAGWSMSLYQYDYKTVRNFRNLKWSESLETGWRITNRMAINQSWMGARNSDYFLRHSAVYNNAWRDAVFLNSNAELQYFVSPGGILDDGSNSAYGEIQWKPHSLTSSFLSASWGSLFASERSRQLLLGELEGLNGFPTAYYAGQARLLFEAEQRFFPSFEFGTIVPAMAVFFNAGNTFAQAGDVDATDLHYSLGLGLRLGASKSVHKVVSHINLSFPLEKEFQRESVWERVKNGFSIRIKESL